jgi:hypothetical protein
MPKPQHSYTHPKNEELLKIFDVTWQWVNLQQRKHIKERLSVLDEKEGRWFSLLSKADPKGTWFIKDRLTVLYHNRAKLEKQLAYYQKLYRDRTETEEKGETYRPKEYDKERILQIPIKNIMALAGRQPARTGYNDDVYLCAFHDDHNASMNVSRSKNLYHCFSCQAGGDVISLYQHLYGCTFPQALKELSALC